MHKMYRQLPAWIKALFITGALLVFLNSLVSLFLPNLVSQFIRMLFVDKSDLVAIDFFNKRLEFPKASQSVVQKNLIIAIILITLVNAFLTLSSTLIIIYASERASEFFRNKLFKKIQELSLRNIADLKPESLITRMSTDVAIFWEFLVNAAIVMVRGVSMTVGGSVLAILVEPTMSIGVILIIPIMAVVIGIIGWKVTPLVKQTQSIVEEVTKNIDENIIGVRVIKTYNLEATRKIKFNDANNRWFKVQYKVNFLFGLITPIFWATVNMLVIIIYAIAANQAIRGVATDDTIVDLNIFIDYLFTISTGIMMMLMFMGSMFRAKISASRINEVYESKSDNLYIKSDIKIDKNFDLKIDDLTFKYYETSPGNALENINLELKEGQTLGILGPTGAGKSTLMNLLMNNYLYTDGSIKIGDKEIREIDTANLHQKVGIVYQSPLLYSGTIKSNLLWAKEDASDEDITNALKNACAYEFVEKFEDKLEHPVIQGGMNLSGGQKQRLSIARTLLRKPKILILDDSTSALDNITTSKVIKNIKENYDCSVIIISQKIGAIKNADQIAVMVNGKIIDRGKHKELLENCELYHQIYSKQLEQ